MPTVGCRAAQRDPESDAVAVGQVDVQDGAVDRPGAQQARGLRDRADGGDDLEPGGPGQRVLEHRAEQRLVLDDRDAERAGGGISHRRQYRLRPGPTRGLDGVDDERHPIADGGEHVVVVDRTRCGRRAAPARPSPGPARAAAGDRDHRARLRRRRRAAVDLRLRQPRPRVGVGAALGPTDGERDRRRGAHRRPRGRPGAPGAPLVDEDPGGARRRRGRGRRAVRGPGRPGRARPGRPRPRATRRCSAGSCSASSRPGSACGR